MRFYVNVDHVATVRQARRTVEPDPVAAAALAEAAGADGITVHLREDRRHIQDDDVVRLCASVTTVLNLELSLSAEILAFTERLCPQQATLVPERREEITTEGGLDCVRHATRIRDALARLRAAGIRTSLFVTADALDAAAGLGADAVELHTGAFANAWPHAGAELRELEVAAERGRALGLAIHAGHGLTYGNVHAVAALSAVEELNIGHTIVSRAVLTGMDEAVRTMREMIDRARAPA